MGQHGTSGEPVSTLFVPDVGRVWRECRRLLVSRGVLIAGFMNPDEFVFDADAIDERGELIVRYPLPYVEYETLDSADMCTCILDGPAAVANYQARGFVITGTEETDEDLPERPIKSSASTGRPHRDLPESTLNDLSPPAWTRRVRDGAHRVSSKA